MDHLLWARSTMAFSLGFHIIFASISMVLPFFMAVAHYRYLRAQGVDVFRLGKDSPTNGTRDNSTTSTNGDAASSNSIGDGSPMGDSSAVHLRLTRAWSKGAAILFATGAVSGTALSFQLGLLWPGFMEHAGPIFGMPFSLEGAAFFLEAIFLGLFLYGWDRLPPRAHFFCGVMVGVCGLASGVLVIAANGWMNAPSGFVWVGDHAEQIDPWAAMFNEAWPLQAAHMSVAAIQATAFAAAGLHALGLLQLRRSDAAAEDSRLAFHQQALRVILPFAVVASLVQPLMGDLIAKSVADRQPEKLAAFEAHFKTERGASLLLGGIVDEATESVSYGVRIPYALSILAHGDPQAEVIGLDRFAKKDRPPVLIPHLAFQVMVGIGMLLLCVSLFCLVAFRFRRHLLQHPLFLKLLVTLTPLGFLALEAGWIVTEVGRQPWILYRVLRTAESVTPVPGLSVTFFTIVILYTTLGALSFWVLRRLYQVEMDRREVAQ